MSCCGKGKSSKRYAGTHQNQGRMRGEWPGWARGLAVLRRPEDTGVGDTVHRIIGDTASATFAKWHKIMFGTDCGCPERRAEWNKTYPYVKERSN